jgi:GT2 family glycosyltransferase
MATAVSLPHSAPRALTTPRGRRHSTGAAHEAPQLSVVIVNFRQWRNTARLTAQLLAAAGARRGAAEVVVVDNHSPPHPLLNRLRRRPGVSLRRLGRNRGFARAANEGCRLAAGRWLLLLNPDMTVEPGFLDEALALAERLPAEEPNAGVVGFRLLNSDGTPQGSCGTFPTLAGTLAGLLLPRARRKCRSPRGGGRRPVDWLTGCCLLVRRDCLAQLGGLDEGFFLYYEDVDFCRRARAAGWSVLFEPGLSLAHHWPLHARRVPASLRVITRHALLTYAGKHWPRWQTRLLTGLVGVESRLRQALAACRGQAEAARLFGELRGIASELTRGGDAEARRRLLGAARVLDTCPAYAATDRPRRGVLQEAPVNRVRA